MMTPAVSPVTYRVGGCGGGNMARWLDMEPQTFVDNTTWLTWLGYTLSRAGIDASRFCGAFVSTTGETGTAGCSDKTR